MNYLLFLEHGFMICQNQITGFRQEAVALADIVQAIRLAHLELIYFFPYSVYFIFRHPAFAAFFYCISKHI